MRKCWEYTRIQILDEEINQTSQILTGFGLHGWEFTGHTEDTGSGTMYLMKRRVYQDA